jgi:hypothetical protein
MKRLTLSLLSLAFCLLLIEAICRLAGLDKRPLFRRSDIPGLIYEFVPSTGGRTRGNPIKINSFGLRDYEFSLEKPQGTFRILGLGGSFTYGEGVALEDTYLKKLEYKLNKTDSSKHYQSINAGVPAYSICQQKIYLEEKGIRFQPDLIIVGFLLGNPCKDSLSPPAYGQKKGIKGTILKISLFLRKHSYLFNFLTERFYSFWQVRHLEEIGEIQKVGFPVAPLPPETMKGQSDSHSKKESPALSGQSAQPQLPVKPVFPESSQGSHPFTKFTKQPSPFAKNTLFHRHYDPNGKYWPRCEQALAEIARLCREMNIAVVLVIWPDLHELNDSHPYLDIYRRVAATGKKYGMEVFELFPVFKGKGAEELWVSPKDFYPNAKAHQLAAEGIYNFLMSRGLINVKRFKQ